MGHSSFGGGSRLVPLLDGLVVLAVVPITDEHLDHLPADGRYDHHRKTDEVHQDLKSGVRTPVHQEHQRHPNREQEYGKADHPDVGAEALGSPEEALHLNITYLPRR